VRDEAALERIRGLAIPPAWTDVWICADPQGHLQAVGVDAAGRRQYLYHSVWRERQDIDKFQRVESFARALPDLRERLERDLCLDGAPKERVMAAAVRLLDRATFRIGSEEYADRHGSFGLATIRKSHVHVDGPTLIFDYVAKAGVRQVHRIDDPLLVPVVERLKRRRSGGLELLAYREDRRWRDVRSTDINAYLKDLLGEEHSAKDFRTWHATVRRVADHLGNTPSVCRASYIDPRVFDRFREGLTVAPALRGVPADDEQAREAVERAVLDMLGGEVRSLAA